MKTGLLSNINTEIIYCDSATLACLEQKKALSFYSNALTILLTHCLYEIISTAGKSSYYLTYKMTDEGEQLNN